MIPSSAFLSWDHAADTAKITAINRLKITYRYFMRISSDELMDFRQKLWKTVLSQLYKGII
jgi:hypothetical protein